MQSNVDVQTVNPKWTRNTNSYRIKKTLLLELQLRINYNFYNSFEANKYKLPTAWF